MITNLPHQLSIVQCTDRCCHIITTPDTIINAQQFILIPGMSENKVYLHIIGDVIKTKNLPSLFIAAND